MSKTLDRDQKETNSPHALSSRLSPRSDDSPTLTSSLRNHLMNSPSDSDANPPSGEKHSEPLAGDHLSDEQLCHLVLQTDNRDARESATETIYGAHRDSVMDSLRRNCPEIRRHAEDRNDVLQTIWGKFFQRLVRRQTPIRNIGGYLQVITLNEIARYRKRIAKQRVFFAKLFSFSSSQEIQMSSSSPQKDLIPELLVVLNERERTVISEHFFCENSYEEIASKLNVSIKTVQRDVKHAEEKMKEAAERNGWHFSVAMLTAPCFTTGLASTTKFVREPIDDTILEVAEALWRGESFQEMADRHLISDRVLENLLPDLLPSGILASWSQWSVVSKLSMTIGLGVCLLLGGFALAISLRSPTDTSTTAVATTISTSGLSSVGTQNTTQSSDAKTTEATSNSTSTPSRRKYVLSEEEKSAIAISLQFIRDSAVHVGGGYNQVPTPNEPTSSVWVLPQLVHYQVLALLEWYDYERDPKDLEAVRNWLEFCAAQSPDGILPELQGTRDKFARTGKKEFASGGAMVLVLLNRYVELGGTVSNEMVTSAKRILASIRSATDDTDGLVWTSSVTTDTKQLDQQVEVFAGLESARQYFTKAGDIVEAELASAQLKKMRGSLLKFYDEQEELFAATIDANGDKFVGPLTDLHVDGFAQLLGLAFVRPNPKTWDLVQQAFPTPDDTNPATSSGTERWVMTASRFDESAVATWRAQMVDVLRTVKPGEAYAYRHGLAVLSLLRGADFIPSLAGETASAVK